MLVIGVDPGPEESAVVVLDGEQIVSKENVPTRDVPAYLCSQEQGNGYELTPSIYVEDFVPYGTRLGHESMRTIKAIGAIEYACPSVKLISRPDVKVRLCGTTKATDADIRDCLIERYGPGKAKAVGKKSEPGPLYGITSHLWSALAVAIAGKVDSER